MTRIAAALTALTFLLIAAGCLPGRSGPGTPAAQQPPPNILLIISDDQGWADYGFMGHPHIETPNLDRLARESLTFTRGYTAAPICRPSLASIITGLYPHQHKITGNDPSLPDGAHSGRSRTNPKYDRFYETVMARIEAHPTLPRMLAKRQYLSLQTGKWWEGNHRRGGFTHGMTHGDPKRRGRHGDVGLTIGRKTMQPIYDFVKEAKLQRRPFFIWYGVFLPHSPHNAPRRLIDKYKAKAPTTAIARYWASVEWFDETCGQLLAFLDEQGLRDDTLVVYVCDNGWIQRPDKTQRFAPRSKTTPYEGGIRTPIMLRWPGRIAPRRDDETLVSSVDLAPTILRACGLQPTADMPGVDLLDKKALKQRRNVVYAEAYEHNMDAYRPHRNLQHRVVIDGWWKLIAPSPLMKAERPQLFNLKSDPHERNDRAESRPELVADLLRKLNAWWDPKVEKRIGSADERR